MDPIERAIEAGAAGLWRRASEKLEEELSQNPGKIEPQLMLAKVYRQSGQLDKLSKLDVEIAKLEDGARSFKGSTDGVKFIHKRDFLPAHSRSDLLSLFDRSLDDMQELGVSRARDGKLIGEVTDRASRYQFGVYCQEKLEKLFQPHIEALLPGFCAELGIPAVGEARHVLRLDYTPDGGFGALHNDSELGARLSYLYYFHRLPKKFSGGDLVFVDTDAESGQPILDQFTRIPIEDNLLIVFDPREYHQVTHVRSRVSSLAPRDSRLSICGFVHARD